MLFTIAGLGNPGEEYEGTRHNTGRIVLAALCKAFEFSPLTVDKKHKALTTRGTIGKHKILVVAPNNFMNHSGASLALFVKTARDAERLIVIYDDLDLPLGSMKISFNKSSGGHRGLESIIRALKTQQFLRIRIGISPTTPAGKLKKPHGEKDVEKHILGAFRPAEIILIKKVAKKAIETIEMLIAHGREKGMSMFH